MVDNSAERKYVKKTYTTTDGTSRLLSFRNLGEEFYVITDGLSSVRHLL